jgi:Sulfotransferase family
MSRAPACESPFLIIGAQRSGTSLLSRILNQHPRLAVPGESYYFNTFGPLSRFYGDLSLPRNRDRLVDDALSTFKIREWSPPLTRAAVLSKLGEPTLGGVFRAILDAWTESQGKSRWGEKTPHHVLYWQEVTKALPDVPLVHIVRDGRDVTLGLIAARFGPKTVYRAAQRWTRYLSAIDDIKAATPARRLHEIRYEDLLQRPEQVLRGICEFLGEPYAPQMLEFHRNPNLYGSGYLQEHANLWKPLMPEKVARWRTMMTAGDLRIFEGVAGRALAAYGYSLATPGTPLPVWERFYLRWIVDPPVKGLALLRNRPGHQEEAHLFWLRTRIILRCGLRRLRGGR